MPRKVELITPYGTPGEGKTDQVREMFDSIAPAYDFMNRAMTFGLDALWRRKAVKMVETFNPSNVLDVATGTADIAIAMARRMPRLMVTGVDLSEQMLRIGLQKVEGRGLKNRITLQWADATDLPFNDAFDCVTIAYGIRNFSSMDGGYRQMFKALRPGGMLLVMELATPTATIPRLLYRFYTSTLIPAIGRLVSHDRRAYSYLPESISAVPQRENMLQIMADAGFTDCKYHSLTFGTCIIYTARKPLK